MAEAKYQMRYWVNVDTVQLGNAAAVISNYFNVAGWLGGQSAEEKKTEQEQDRSTVNIHFDRFMIPAPGTSLTREVKISIF